jgi:hypothetical protein
LTGAAHEHDVTVDALAYVVRTTPKEVEWNVVGPLDVCRVELRRSSHVDYQGAVIRLEEVAQVAGAESVGSCGSHGHRLPALRDGTPVFLARILRVLYLVICC